MQSIRNLFHAALASMMAGTHPAQSRNGTRGRGSRHPRRLPDGHRAQRRRLQRLQKAARRENRS